jgi:hypothetical protein
MRSPLATIGLAILFFNLQGFAYTPQEGDVSASMGPFLYKTNFKGGQDRAESNYKADFGLLVQGDSSDKGSLEISLFHMNKSFFRDQGGDFLAEEVELMQVGLGYRRWLGHYFSAALDFYSSYAISDPHVIHSTNVSGNPLDTSASDITEYGLEGSLQAELWSQGRFGLIFDARYAHSFTSKENESGDHYGGLLALRYFVQGKNR